MKSKKKLFEFFKEKYGKELSLESPGVSNETYGKTSMVYVYSCGTVLGVPRMQVRDDLVAAGFQLPGGWGASFDGVEIRVSYFKGWHWDE